MAPNVKMRYRKSVHAGKKQNTGLSQDLPRLATNLTAEFDEEESE